MAHSFSKFPSAHPGPVPQPGSRLTPRRKQRKLSALRQLLFYQKEAVPWLSALSKMFFPPDIHKANSLAAVKFYSDDAFSMRPPRLLWQPCY